MANEVNELSLAICQMFCFQASAEGIQGNFSGDLLQSGGMLIVAKGTVGSHHLMSVVVI